MPTAPPAAANAIHSASTDRSGFLGSNVVLRAEFSSVAYPVVPGKKTPIPPTTCPFLNSGMPPGRVAIPRFWAFGNRPVTNPYESGANSVCPGGTNAGLMSNRPMSGMSSAVPRTPSGPGWMLPSRLVCSMANRSTSGVLGTFGGKWAPMRTGATYPGPALSGVDVRDVRVGRDLPLGDGRLAQVAHRPRGERGLVVAEERPGPGQGHGSVDGEHSQGRVAEDHGRHPPSVRTPRMRPLRSTIGNDGVVARRRRGRPAEQGPDLGRRSGPAGPGRRPTAAGCCTCTRVVGVAATGSAAVTRTTLSAPPPGTTLVDPAPPTNSSLPGPPTRWFDAVPPTRVLAPVPPTMRVGPPPAWRVSLPAPPSMTAGGSRPRRS